MAFRVAPVMKLNRSIKTQFPNAEGYNKIPDYLKY